MAINLWKVRNWDLNVKELWSIQLTATVTVETFIVSIGNSLFFYKKIFNKKTLKKNFVEKIFGQENRFTFFSRIINSIKYPSHVSLRKKSNREKILEICLWTKTNFKKPLIFPRCTKIFPSKNEQLLMQKRPNRNRLNF